ncbi:MULTISPECIES: tripartite tricarboxylate transporter substrate binding protein [unclassified Acidovorax]|uniref:tripartite tricarboxylate transporter substrate binding protein n=1 Tax=unclassified Acidovorax TaxID=2684926 RepID=UPI000C196166|nr:MULTISPECIES: tripartite tricarboxylate transporter substrate binding protein [unclassified Acidovorax]MBD9405438.1 tripartite tricarboxylate transporter substrate binding protein [Acidovorax sp. ACV02]PIF19063.1 tripartite-type tricarboxylate transporter receptor subunit TctC [Acidovorax sp. 59]PKW01909.1 tripartite-type tricarboxylate transporter receptor subunit TctC [Acidovorax sp. 30]
MNRPQESAPTSAQLLGGKRSSSTLTRRTTLAALGTTLAAPWIGARANGLAGGRPISLVVSYPAGGGADLMARILAPRLSEALGQSVVVENKPGASGQLAAAAVARATPDGTSLLLDASSFAVNPSLYPKLPYDSNAAFTPLAILATFPNVLVCHPGFEAKTVQDVIAKAKAQPDSVAYASSGNGSAQHLAGALFEQRTGIKLSHIPYRGGGPAMNDVMGGQVPLFFANVASSLGHIQAGKLRPLAVTSTLRARSLPNIPTMGEVGVTDYEVLEWNPLLAPAGISADTRKQLVAAVRKALADPEVLGRIRALGGDSFQDATQASAGKFIQAQQALWGKLVRDRKIVAG